MKVYLVSAFTHQGRGGNGAGVVLCEGFPGNNQMQEIAKAIGFSETVFVCPGEDVYTSKFFTPQCEVPLCGHATIAAFHLMGYLGYIRGNEGTVTATQETGAGRLPVCIEFVRGRPGRVFMEQSKPSRLGALDREDLKELCICLGLELADLGIENSANTLPEIISTGLPDIIVPVLTKNILDGINPEFERLAGLSRRLGVVGAHVFTMQTENPEFTVRCRNFGPAVGINEEAATGTSNGALGYYLYKRGMLTAGGMACEQGFGMGKPSAIYVRAGQEGVWVGGEAAITGERDINL